MVTENCKSFCISSHFQVTHLTKDWTSWEGRSYKHLSFWYFGESQCWKRLCHQMICSGVCFAVWLFWCLTSNSCDHVIQDSVGRTHWGTRGFLNMKKHSPKIKCDPYVPYIYIYVCVCSSCNSGTWSLKLISWAKSWWWLLVCLEHPNMIAALVITWQLTTSVSSKILSEGQLGNHHLGIYHTVPWVESFLFLLVLHVLKGKDHDMQAYIEVNLAKCCFPYDCVLLLMEEILHHLIGSWSHYLQCFFLPWPNPRA